MPVRLTSSLKTDLDDFDDLETDGDASDVVPQRASIYDSLPLVLEPAIGSEEDGDACVHYNGSGDDLDDVRSEATAIYCDGKPIPSGLFSLFGTDSPPTLSSGGSEYSERVTFPLYPPHLSPQCSTPHRSPAPNAEAASPAPNSTASTSPTQTATKFQASSRKSARLESLVTQLRTPTIDKMPKDLQKPIDLWCPSASPVPVTGGELRTQSHGRKKSSYVDQPVPVTGGESSYLDKPEAQKGLAPDLTNKVASAGLLSLPMDFRFVIPKVTPPSLITDQLTLLGIPSRSFGSLRSVGCPPALSSDTLEDHVRDMEVVGTRRVRMSTTNVRSVPQTSSDPVYWQQLQYVDLFPKSANNVPPAPSALRSNPRKSANNVPPAPSALQSNPRKRRQTVDWVNSLPSPPTIPEAGQTMSDSATLFRSFDAQRFTMPQQSAQSDISTTPAGTLWSGVPAATGGVRLVCSCGQAQCPDKVAYSLRTNIMQKQKYRDLRQAQEVNPAAFPSWAPPMMNTLTLRLLNDGERLAAMARAVGTSSAASSSATSTYPPNVPTGVDSFMI
ncbi:MAG: hypothetical protein KVP17_002446 [Porospora cf. gigantea B]|uniref:uncharacterized protein n=1 Tax=Porospora cf. gigantea B TaxID=2853592 RepID=UPI003571D673|nr:MAG: hypothetical protein KVP17_002446 [Porospora cf. gigantea B]